MHCSLMGNISQFRTGLRFRSLTAETKNPCHASFAANPLGLVSVKSSAKPAFGAVVTATPVACRKKLHAPPVPSNRPSATLTLLNFFVDQHFPLYL